MSKALILGAAALALSAGVASAQVAYPDYGYAPYGYGYSGYYPAAAPLYDYAAPAYAAPGTAGTTVIIVTPGQGYAPPPVASSYYNFAPGYWGGGGWPAGYGWR